MSIALEEEIPTKTSQLSNDSGFITSSDIPEQDPTKLYADGKMTYLKGDLSYWAKDMWVLREGGEEYQLLMTYDNSWTCNSDPSKRLEWQPQANYWVLNGAYTYIADKDVDEIIFNNGMLIYERHRSSQFGDLMVGEVPLKSDLANFATKSTTLSGYGITDAYTKAEVENLGYLSALSSSHFEVKDTTLADASRGGKYQVAEIKSSGGKKMVYGMCTD